MIVDQLNVFDNYFTSTWINEYYNVSDWSQYSDVSFRTNNWSEVFHSAFGKRFRRAHPNLIVSIRNMIDAVNQYQFEYNDYMFNPSKYIIGETNVFTLELLTLMNERQTKYKDDKDGYLLALATIHLKISLKIEKELLLFNKDNESRIKTIDDMLEHGKTLSLLEIEDEEILKQKHKLKAITNFNLEKRIKKLKEMIENKQYVQRSKKVDKLLNQLEIDKLQKMLNEIERSEIIVDIPDDEDECNYSEEDYNDYITTDGKQNNVSSYNNNESLTANDNEFETYYESNLINNVEMVNEKEGIRTVNEKELEIVNLENQQIETSEINRDDNYTSQSNSILNQTTLSSIIPVDTNDTITDEMILFIDKIKTNERKEMLKVPRRKTRSSERKKKNSKNFLINEEPNDKKKRKYTQEKEKEKDRNVELETKGMERKRDNGKEKSNEKSRREERKR